MKKIVSVNDKKITIRSLKFKELKSMVSVVGEKIDEVITFFDKKSDDNFINVLPTFIVENMDFIAGYILKFSDIKKDEIEDMDVLDIVEVTKELLKINGVDMEKVKVFFQQLTKTNLGVQVQNMNNQNQFIEAVPNT
jgi:hypothetical protein